MSESRTRTSPLRVAVAWIVVATPLAWGVYETAIKSLPLFHAPAATPAPARSGARTAAKNTVTVLRDGLANGRRTP